MPRGGGVRPSAVSPNRGLSRISIAVDCHVVEALDLTRLVTGRIPRLFGR